MKHKSILAIITVIIMILSFVGCSSNERQVIKLTLSTQDSEAILAAAGVTLPDIADVGCANSVVEWFSWFDDFHNYSEDEIVNTGYFTFEEKYGCEIEWVECTWAERYDKLANLMLTDDSPDFYPAEAASFPTYQIKGLYSPVDEYIDYSAPLWKDVSDFAHTYFSLGDSCYMIVTDITFDTVMCYNRRIFDEHGFDDPATLFYNNEWTWQVMENMCYEFTDPDEEIYAFDDWYYYMALLDSSGATTLALNPETHLFETDINNPALERAARLLYDLNKNECIYPWHLNGWALRGGSAIKDGKLLFSCGGIKTFTGPVESIQNTFGDVTEQEVMFVPMPRDENGDGNYYMQTMPAGYMLLKGGDNLEGAALLAACDRFKVTDPTVVSIDRRQLEEIYLWTDEMLAMWDTCYELANTEHVIVRYAQGLGSKLYEVLNKGIEESYHPDNGVAKTWAQVKEESTDRLNHYVGELNDDITEYINS